MTNEKEEYAEFLTEHKGEIIGLYRDTYYKNGGWNGMMDAISDVKNRHGIEAPEFEDGEFEEIYEEIFGQ